MNSAYRIVAWACLLIGLDGVSPARSVGEGGIGAEGAATSSVDTTGHTARGVRLELDVVTSKAYPRNGPIPVLVELINEGQDDVLACIDTKGQQAGFVEFEVFKRWRYMSTRTSLGK